MTSLHTPVKAVLFDLDDTLFDHRHSTLQGLIAVREAYSGLQQHSLDMLFADYVRLLDEVHLRVLEGSLTIDEARQERFSRFFQIYLPDLEDLAAAVEHAATLHRTFYQSSRQVVTGAVALLEHLYGQVKVAIVTNNIVEEQIEKLRHLKLEHLVDELVTSEETGFIKPDPRIFHVALERCGCRAEEAVFIGDAWKPDILGARQAGIRAIWFNRTGMASPDPTYARELLALEPLAEVVKVILASE